MTVLRGIAFWGAALLAHGLLFAASGRSPGAAGTGAAWSAIGAIALAALAAAALLALAATARRARAGLGGTLAALLGAGLGLLGAALVLMPLVLLAAFGLVMAGGHEVGEGKGLAIALAAAVPCWIGALAVAPAGAALAHGGRPVDRRAVGAGQRWAVAASLAAVGITTALPAVPPFTGVEGVAIPVVVIAASVAGYLRARGSTPAR